jgi:anti-sigma-K factor RskA
LDIQEYISSGILESYVLGALSADEAHDVERMAAIHPEVKKELDEIQESMNNYASVYSKAPNPSLKEKILIRIDESANVPSASDDKIISISKKKFEFTEYLAAASISFAILSAGMAFLFYTRWQDAENKVMALEAQNTVVAQHSNTVNFNLQQELNETTQQLSTVLDSNTRSVELKGLPISPSSKAVVFWNKNSQQVYLSIKNLPSAPDDKQYQLWALKDGKPIDAGVFELDSAIQKMSNIDDAQAFAVTLEKKGGSPTPNLEALYLMGNI